MSDVKLLNGTLTADKLRITGGGEVVRFEGNVVMNLDHLSSGDASDQQSEKCARRIGGGPPSPAPDAVSLGQVSQLKNDFQDDVFPPPQPSRIRRIVLLRLCRRPGARDDRGQGRLRQSTMQGRCQCDAGLFRKNRDQPIQIEAASLEMRDKKKGGDVCRQCEGGCRATPTMDLEDAGGVLRFDASALPPAAGGQFEIRKIGDHTVRNALVPAAVRRYAGWRREAAWS